MKRPSPLRLSVEKLEDRLTPTWGVGWYNPGQLTLSFAPDGTDVSGSPNSLHALLGPDNASWEREILRAFQTWAIQTNVNIGLVGDGGQAFGVAGLAGDSHFGDIRIGSRPLSDTASGKDLAGAIGFDYSGGTWSGDVLLNSLYQIGVGDSPSQYDLYSVVLHEASHSFGFADETTDPGSVMYSGYKVWTGLTPGDITAIQSLYGVRTGDPFEGTAGNGTLAGAFDLTENGNLTSISADITQLGDVDYYRFTTPSASSVTGLTVNLQTAGISLLTARVTVLDANGNEVASAVATDPLSNNLSISLPNYQASTTYYVKVEGAGSDVFSAGALLTPIALRTRCDRQLVRARVVLRECGDGVERYTRIGDSARLLEWYPRGDVYRGRYARQFHRCRLVPDHTERLTDYSGTLTVGVVPMEPNGIRANVAVFDAQGQQLNTIVVTNENGAFTVQLADQHPDTTYFLRVMATDPSGSHATGGYALAANLARTAVTTFDDLTTGALNNTDSTLASQMTLAGGKLTQFSFSASTAADAPESAVRMSIFDSTGQMIFTMVAEAGNLLTTGTVWLGAGTYTVVFNGATRDGSALQGLTFNLSARERSDPMDPLPENPIPTLPPPPGVPLVPPPPPPTPIVINNPVPVPPAPPVADPIPSPFAGA